MSSQRWAAALCAAVAAFASPAGAQPAAPPASAPARASVPDDGGDRALHRLASRIAAEVAQHDAPPPVGLFIRGDSAELARAFGTVLAARLAQQRRPAQMIDAPSAQQAEAAAREQGARSLVRLTLSLESGLLHARGDLLGTWVNFWAGRSPTRPPSVAAALEGSAEADAHALALAAQLLTGPVATAPRTGEVRLVGGVFARIAGWTAALAAGDLDGDGRDEVVALTDEEVLAFSHEGRLLARRDHRQALPPAASPSREPFGAIAVLQDPPRVAYTSAQRQRGEQLALEGPRGGFRVLGPQQAAPFGSTGAQVLSGQLVPGLNVFQPALTTSGGAEIVTPWPFTTSSLYSGPSGAQLLVVAPGGAGAWRGGLTAEAPGRELTGLGAASALVDVDGDGTAELITTEPVFRPEPEVLRVLLGPASAPAEPSAPPETVRFRVELPRGRALQIVGAHFDAEPAQVLIVAVWMPDGTTELQLFRRAP